MRMTTTAPRVLGAGRTTVVEIASMKMTTAVSQVSVIAGSCAVLCELVFSQDVPEGMVAARRPCLAG